MKNYNDVRDVNDKVLDIFGIDCDRSKITKVTINITPTNFPEIIIESLLFEGDTLRGENIFELRKKPIQTYSIKDDDTPLGANPFMSGSD